MLTGGSHVDPTTTRGPTQVLALYTRRGVRSQPVRSRATSKSNSRDDERSHAAIGGSVPRQSIRVGPLEGQLWHDQHPHGGG